MVRALLGGRKTQTRRVVKGMALDWLDNAGFDPAFVADPDNSLCPYGGPGDVLWVKETWRMPDSFDRDSPTKAKTRVRSESAPNVFYVADGAVRSAGSYTGVPGKTRVSIHMPRWASRLNLRITDVRVERLNDCSETDALAEGVVLNDLDEYVVPGIDEVWQGTAGAAYQELWEHINGPGSWAANPWVWAVSFEVVNPDGASTRHTPSDQQQRSEPKTSSDARPSTRPDAGDA